MQLLSCSLLLMPDGPMCTHARLHVHAHTHTYTQSYTHTDKHARDAGPTRAVGLASSGIGACGGPPPGPPLQRAVPAVCAPHQHRRCVSRTPCATCCCSCAAPGKLMLPLWGRAKLRDTHGSCGVACCEELRAALPLHAAPTGWRVRCRPV